MTEENYEPEAIRVNVKRLTPREISTIEEHTGYSARQWEDSSCPVGKLSQAMAYVMLRRRDPSANAKDLWNRANDTIVETDDEDPPSESGND